MDNIDAELSDPDELSIESQLPCTKEHRGNDGGLPSSFKIVAVQSLAGNENIAQNFLSEMHDDLRKAQEKRPKLKIVPIASLKSPVTVNPTENNLIESTNAEDATDDEQEDEHEIPIKRFRIDKLGHTSSNLSPKPKETQIENKSPGDENDGESRPSGSSRRKSRITTRNAECDEPSVMNNMVVNGVREDLAQKTRELPHGSKTELELMRNVAFLRVCVNHILTKIGRRPITYDRNNQTLASLIQKYSKS